MNDNAIINMFRERVERLGLADLSEDDGLEFELPFTPPHDPIPKPFVFVVTEPGYSTGGEMFESEDEVPVPDSFVQINDALFDDVASTTGSIEDFVSSVWTLDINENVDDFILNQEWDNIESGEEADDEEDMEKIEF